MGFLFKTDFLIAVSLTGVNFSTNLKKSSTITHCIKKGNQLEKSYLLSKETAKKTKKELDI